MNKLSTQQGIVAPIQIGNDLIGETTASYVIAEIGVNHEGDVASCAEMIKAAAGTGANAVKLQTVDADASYVRGTESHTLFQSCALSQEETAAMFDLARSLGISPMTTSGDLATLEWVDRLNPVAHKISSGLLTHMPMIEKTARTSRPLIMSTGMAQLDDIDNAVICAQRAGASDIAILQCTSLYPAPEDSVNLAAMRFLQNRFCLPVGFSDHTLATDVAALAIAAGARIIEKHFTNDRKRAGFDHGISLEADGFSQMVVQIRRAEKIYGSMEKILGPSELEMRNKSHRILVASKDVTEGERLEEACIAIKRPLPGTVGLVPAKLDQVVGKRTKKGLRRDDPILWSDLQI